MKSLSVLKVLGVLSIATSCAENNYLVRRDISSEPEKYILSSDSVQKKMKELKVTPLNDSECFSDPETKIYFTNVRASATGNFKELKSQIDVTKLENTDSTEYYFCRVTCLLDTKYAAFWVTLTDSPNRHSDDNAFICGGVSMEMVNIPGTSLQTLGPIVHNYSVFALQDVMPKLKETKYKVSPGAKQKLDEKMNKDFIVISKAYIGSSMPAMIEAGKILDQIAYQKPGYKAVLDKYVLMAKNVNGKLKLDVSKDYFVLMNILQSGRHLVYEKL